MKKWVYSKDSHDVFCHNKQRLFLSIIGLGPENTQNFCYELKLFSKAQSSAKEEKKKKKKVAVCNFRF